MGKQFVIKKLDESYEIQRSYDKRNYLEAVVQCRTYLEGWLIEYIYAVLHPALSTASRENRELVESKFPTMFVQMSWLLQQGYISKGDYDNINKIRIFCDDVIKKNDVFKVANRETLDKYIEAAVHHCYKLKQMTRDTIEKAIGQKIQS